MEEAPDRNKGVDYLLACHAGLRIKFGTGLIRYPGTVERVAAVYYALAFAEMTLFRG